MEEGPFPSDVLDETLRWGKLIGEEWRSNLKADTVADRWTLDLARWIHDRPPEEKGRVWKGLRKLRRVAPREYDVLFRMLISGDNIEEVTAWLNERAQRHGHKIVYREKDTLALLIAGIDYVRSSV